MSISLKVIANQNFHKTTPAYEKFAEEKDQCRKCEIYTHYQKVVQSEGNASDPTFFIVGEAPGADEVSQGRPFIGQAGQRLRQTLRQHVQVFNKSTTLISNTIPCRPKDNKFPDDTKLVDACCYDWLNIELQLVRPKIVIALGNTPLKYVLGRIGVTKERGKWIPLYGRGSPMWFFATYHPSYVIRCERAKQLNVVQEFEQDFALIAKEYAQRLTMPVI